MAICIDADADESYTMQMPMQMGVMQIRVSFCIA